jgi:hypothetical protein
VDENGNTIELTLSDPIVGTTYFYAEYIFDGYIEDDWQTIINGDKDAYGLGGKKKTTINYLGLGSGALLYTDEVEFEIIGKEHDTLADSGEKAKLTMRGKLDFTAQMNLGPKEWNEKLTLDGGGWALSDMRAWLNGERFFDMLPEELRNGIKTVVKLSDNGGWDYATGNPTLTETQDKIFIASLQELNAHNPAYTLVGQGEPYPIFTDNFSRTLDNIYWTRSTAGQEIK